jgi:NitT/TauT family transport system ATP-binding protein
VEPLVKDKLNRLERPRPEAREVAIQIERLSLGFGGRSGAPAIRVLDEVELEVEQGEFVCIVGPSGCGKSTLLNVIAGFVRPDEGEVRVEGELVTGPDRRRILVFQESGVFPWSTVEENIRFGLDGKSRTEQNELIGHYLAMVGLLGFERCYPRELSGGMRQRLEIARALAASPDIIYMDEPFGALDYLTRLRMRADLIRLWQAERKTILLVTHDIEEAVQLADRVLVMSARPSRVKATVNVDLPRPRDIDAPEYLALRDLVLANIEWGGAGAATPDDEPLARDVGPAPRKRTVELPEVPDLQANPCQERRTFVRNPPPNRRLANEESPE